MNYNSPILYGGLIITFVVFIIILIFVLFSGFKKTKEVEKELLSDANKLERKRKCPDDKTLMNKEVINEIVIDKCPFCGGIFLDKNELETIKKRSSNTTEFGYVIAFILAFLMK